MAGLEVSGRRFQTEADYKAALRDQAKIEKIRTRVDMEQPGEVIQLYIDMQSGKYRFETAVGNDFDDKIYELAQQYKGQGYTKDSVLSVETKKKPLLIRGSKRTEARPLEQAGTVRSDQDIRAGKQKVEARALDAYDEEMQREILLELKKREKRRRWTVILCSAVAVACF